MAFKSSDEIIDHFLYKLINTVFSKKKPNQYKRAISEKRLQGLYFTTSLLFFMQKKANSY